MFLVSNAPEYCKLDITYNYIIASNYGEGRERNSLAAQTLSPERGWPTRLGKERVGESRKERVGEERGGESRKERVGEERGGESRKERVGEERVEAVIWERGSRTALQGGEQESCGAVGNLV